MVILNIAYFSNQAFGRQFYWFFGDMMLYIMIYRSSVRIREHGSHGAPQPFRGAVRKAGAPDHYLSAKEPA